MDPPMGLRLSTGALREKTHTVVDLTVGAAMGTKRFRSSQRWSLLGLRPAQAQHQQTIVLLVRTLLAQRRKLQSVWELGSRRQFCP